MLPRISTYLISLGLVALWSGCLIADDIHVDPVHGDDGSGRSSKVLKTIGKAIQVAQPGDTIHLSPITYRDWAAFFDKSGAPGKPIVLDGHGATLDGCDVLSPNGWTETEAGLFKNDDLMPLTDAIIDRWFFVFDGIINRMARCSKGPSEPLKSPNELGDYEWTFIKDLERSKSAKTGYIFGSFWIRLPKDKSFQHANIEYPFRMAGVAMRGKCSHFVVRNLTATRPYNDGFNLSDCQDVRLENIQAIDCGDDGISAHGHCKYEVFGFRSIGNATGICDTGESETAYDKVFIERCIGFDLYFLGTGTYKIENAHIRSTSTRPLYLQGDESSSERCKVLLKNVWLERLTAGGEVRVSSNCTLEAVHCTFSNLNWQATGGNIAIERCCIEGDNSASTSVKPQLHLWPKARWTGRENHYDWGSVRVGERSFSEGDLLGFQSAVESDESSRWGDLDSQVQKAGVDQEMLPQ